MIAQLGREPVTCFGQQLSSRAVSDTRVMELDQELSMTTIIIYNHPLVQQPMQAAAA
jgi:hypothetical protein